GFFVYVGMEKFRALIPGLLGVLWIGAGIMARNEKLRMHAMHAAALLGLIGFAAPAVMVALAIGRGSELELVKHGEQAAMAILCGVFVGLCVKSFIDARRARKSKEAEMPSTAPPVDS